MQRIAAEYEAAHPGLIHGGSSRDESYQAGVWTRERAELLFQLIREAHPEFDAVPTERLNGWQVWCPGNNPESHAWPDGEWHHEPYSAVNDSSIMWIDAGELCYRCAHSHCDESSDHGKKGREDFLKFYDPDYSLRLRALGNKLTPEEENLAELFAERALERVNVEQEEEDGRKEEMGGEERLSSVAPVEDSDPYDIAFPEECMYGPLGDSARDIKMDLGIAYPAILGTYSVMPQPQLVDFTRNSLYVGLIMPPGGGKDVVLYRSRRNLGIPLDEKFMSRTSPSSDRGLMNLLKHKVKRRKGKDDEITLGPAKMLIALNEMITMLSKGKLDNSTLYSMLCALWSDSHYGLVVKEGQETCDCQLSVMGGIPIENPGDVSIAFGAAAASGLHSRFVFGHTTKRYRWLIKDSWKPAREGKLLRRVHTDVVVTSVDPLAENRYDEWNAPEDKTGRIRENALRIAALSAAAAGETEISEACMIAALKFADWQLRLHRVFIIQPARNQAAELENRIISAWRSCVKGNTQKAMYFSRFAHKYDLYEYGSFMVTRAFEAMLKTKRFVYAPRLDAEGNPKRDRDGVVVLSKKVVLNEGGGNA